MTTYDKAKWHFEGDFPKDLPIIQGYVHIGMYLGWAVGRGFEGSLLLDDFSDELDDFRSGKITGTRLLEITDGVLEEEMLSEEGNLFTSHYYDRYYLSDYSELFSDKETAYHVEDTLENSKTVKAKLDESYTKWKTNQIDQTMRSNEPRNME